MSLPVHTFGTTGEAYDASQTDDGIKDGHVLAVPSEGVVGIMVDAWPVAVGERHGAFHTLADGVEWDAVPKSEYPGPTTYHDYTLSFRAAIEALDMLGMRGGGIHEAQRR